MERLEYQVTRHGSETFSKLVYFCSASGDCSLEQVPAGEPEALVAILNEHGDQGWELIQLVFGSDGLIALWKRRMSPL